MAYTRREFIQHTAAAGVGAAAVSQVPAAQAEEPLSDGEFRSNWRQVFDRVWIGEAYWANPLQDWRVSGGRLECVKPAANRHVHLLTRQLGEKPGDLRMSVRVGRVGDEPLGKGAGSVGFRVGVIGPLREYRNSLIFGQGLDAGLTAKGRLFIGGPSTTGKAIDVDRRAVTLTLTATPQGAGYRVTLAASDPESDEKLGEVVREGVPAERLVGNLALAVNFPAGGRRQGNRNAGGGGQFWFDDWRVSGAKVETHDDQVFGPILFSQYTLSRGVLKLSAQMPPVGEQDNQTVQLQLKQDGQWKTVGEDQIHGEARTASFRLENWDATRDAAYRLRYVQKFKDGREQEDVWTGTIRRDPADQPALTVGDVSCNIHAAFPNVHYTANMAQLNPDLLAFVGDQFYESSGGYGVQRSPLQPAILDYLRKWYMHGWTWRELMRDRPSISIPDDHDVYHGNLWGEGGAGTQGPIEAGGYSMPGPWVQVVHRTQTSHLPDAWDPTPCKRGLSVYSAPLEYGRVSFAILADRQFKTGPQGEAPPTGGRADHVTDPNFDPHSADKPGLQLIGERQLGFLREWAADWRGADMKAIFSQTIFTAMATTHGGNRQRLVADYDTNGWPQTQRNQALREIRKAFAFHIAGDQHLPAVVHYGVDTHRDAGLAFAGPAVNTGYPRWFEPAQPGENRAAGAPENTGDFLDSFGHPMTVLAVANGAVKPSKQGVLEQLHEKVSGIGLVRFDKRRRTITVECWPLLADVTQTSTQFPGWPVTVAQLDNFAFKAQAALPKLKVTGVKNPVVQIIDEATGEIVYTVRMAGQEFQPRVLAPGNYAINVGDPDAERWKRFDKVAATPDNKQRLDVRV